MPVSPRILCVPLAGTSKNTVARQFKTHRKTRRSVRPGEEGEFEIYARPPMHRHYIGRSSITTVRRYDTPSSGPSEYPIAIISSCLHTSLESIRLFPEVIDIRVIGGTVIPRSYRTHESDVKHFDSIASFRIDPSVLLFFITISLKRPIEGHIRRSK